MNPTRQTDPELDRLIAEITVDCYDDDEDASFPIPATLLDINIHPNQAGSRLLTAYRHWLGA